MSGWLQVFPSSVDLAMCKGLRPRSLLFHTSTRLPFRSAQRLIAASGFLNSVLWAGVQVLPPSVDSVCNRRGAVRRKASKDPSRRCATEGCSPCDCSLGTFSERDHVAPLSLVNRKNDK